MINFIKSIVMKKMVKRISVALLSLAMLTACSGFKGSANDRTGTNGATNGNGKTAPGTDTHKVRN